MSIRASKQTNISEPWRVLKLHNDLDASVKIKSNKNLFQFLSKCVYEKYLNFIFSHYVFFFKFSFACSLTHMFLEAITV